MNSHAGSLGNQNTTFAMELWLDTENGSAASSWIKWSDPVHRPCVVSFANSDASSVLNGDWHVQSADRALSTVTLEFPSLSDPASAQQLLAALRRLAAASETGTLAQQGPIALRLPVIQTAPQVTRFEFQKLRLDSELQESQHLLLQRNGSAGIKKPVVCCTIRWMEQVRHPA